MLKREREDKRIKKTTRIKWDEEIINEHDKERGTRQKIDEPPTPYEYCSEEECDASNHTSTFESGIGPLENWELVKAKLLYKEIKTGPECRRHDDENDTECFTKLKSNEFHSKRAAHYNEFQLMKVMRKKVEEQDDNNST